MIKNKLVIKNNDYSEPLNSVLPDTFQVQKTVNQSWQLQFNAYNDKSVAFSLLQAQNSILYEGQEFIIKQTQPVYSNDFTVIQVTATHIGYEVSRLFQHNTNAGTKTYSVNDVLSFYLNGNSFGYSWEVIGNFDNQQIDNLGNSNGQDMMSKIINTWSNAIITFDNKKIKVFNSDDYYQDKGKVITYLGNSSQVQLTYDSTSLVNKLYCISDNGSDENSQPPFQPFYVTNDDSIKKYGVYEGNPISDNRFNNADAMRQYAESQLVPEPTISIQSTFITNDDIDVGEIRTLIIPELDLTTKVKVTQVSLYPLSDNQQNQVQLDNTAKTILNYNDSLHNRLTSSVGSVTNINQSITNAIQNNQDEINKINNSLKQQTLKDSNNYGTVTFTLNTGVIYVSCTFNSLVANKSSWNVPKDFIPSNQIEGTLVVYASGTNYLVNYSLSSTFDIKNIVSITNQEATELDNCNGSFSYLI